MGALSVMQSLLMAQPHVETAQGEVATFDTDFKAPLKSLTINIEPVQAGSGDPSFPDNVRPISGWTGLNIGNAQQYNRMPPSSGESISANGITLVHIGNGKYRIFGTSTSSGYLPTMRTNAFSIPSGDGRECDFNNSAAIGSIQFIDGINLVDTWALRTVNRISTGYLAMAGKRTDGFRIAIPAGQTVDFTIQPVFMKNATIIPINWSSEAGTVYGCALDVKNGVIVPIYEKFTGIGSSLRTNSGYRVLRTTYNATKYDYKRTLSNMFKTVATAGAFKEWKMQEASRGVLYWAFPTPDYTDEQILEISPNVEYCLMIREEQRTPIQLTPIQLEAIIGKNNIWSDAGIVEVKFWKHG